MRGKRLQVVVTATISVAVVGALLAGVVGSLATATADDIVACSVTNGPAVNRCGTCSVSNGASDPSAQDGCGPFPFQISPTSGPIYTLVTVDQGDFPCDPPANAVEISVFAAGNVILVGPVTVATDGSGNWSTTFVVPPSAVAYDVINVSAECFQQVDPFAVHAEQAALPPLYIDQVFTLTASPSFGLGSPDLPRLTFGAGRVPPFTSTPAPLPPAPAAAPVAAGAKFTG